MTSTAMAETLQKRSEAVLRMTFASWPYDRLEALKDGVVKPEGLHLDFLPSHPGDTFLRMLGKREFESSEMSVSSLLMTKERDDPFVAIPIFTSRTFRHNGLFINTDSGIKEPRDLIGKRVGLPEYQITSTLWLRGILQHEYDVLPTQIKWFAERWGEGMHSHGSSIGFKAPKGVSISTIPPEEDQISLLMKGELDAAFLIQELPSSICRSSLSQLPRSASNIRRLFENYKQVEMDYFKRTGLFPIMHTVVLRRDIYERYPWAAKSLFDAMCESKKRFYEIRKEWELFSFPWIRQELEELRNVMGEDPYPYGMAGNKKVLDAISLYSFEQGLTSRYLQPERLFAPELLGT